jgi:hypothetical protein
MIFLPIPIFISEFPYVKFKKRYSPNEYKRFDNSVELNQKSKDMIKTNRDLLSLNQVPLDKIRFVFNPCFTYDVDKNIINPKYETFIPLRKDGSGLFDNKAPVIEFGKPEKLMMVTVLTYKVDDNYEFIKEMIKKSKRGVVIFIADDTTFFNEQYQFSVDSEVIRLVNLDEATEYYKFNTVEA